MGSDATQATPEPIPDPRSPIPDPLFQGQFAVFPHPDGGYVLVTEIEGRGVEQRHIPGMLVRFIQSDNPVTRTMARAFGGGGDQ